MAHKDINKNYREIRELEQRITDEILSSAEVLLQLISVLDILPSQIENSLLS